MDCGGTKISLVLSMEEMDQCTDKQTCKEGLKEKERCKIKPYSFLYITSATHIFILGCGIDK